MNESERSNNVKTKDQPFKLKEVDNYYGSSAGASSGNFHLYRSGRREELDRLEALDKKERDDALDMEFQTKVAKQKQDETLKTQKNAAKRKRKKELRKQKNKMLKTKEAQEEPEKPLVQEENVKDKELEKLEEIESAKAQNRFANDGSFLDAVKALKETFASSSS